jgi:hypothetical protein
MRSEGRNFILQSPSIASMHVRLQTIKIQSFADYGIGWVFATKRGELQMG